MVIEYQVGKWQEAEVDEEQEAQALERETIYLEIMSLMRW